MELKGFENYPELSQFKKISPAISRYTNLVEKAPLGDFDRLRILRHKYWLNTACATLHGHPSTEEVCQYWSQKTDLLLCEAWKLSQCNELDFALFALGKLGASELNLSSDVDLVAISKLPANIEMQGRYKNFINLLSKNSDFGFCFRVDTTLRPGGRFGPMISSLNQTQDYYWNYGATWERLALIRLRPICGSSVVISETMELIQNFVYRKYLDYTLFSDLKLLRKKIHAERKKASNVHLKLDPGGIRDIELFINALQVIHGGRSPSVRTLSTTKAVDTMTALNAFPQDELKFLINVYWQLRDLENLVQAIEDRQTHVITSAHTKLRKHTLDIPEIQHLNQKVSNIVEGLIGVAEADNNEGLPTDQAQWLANQNFNLNSIENVWPQLLNLTAMSTRTEHDEGARTKFLRAFVEELAKQKSGKDIGLSLLMDFVKSARAKATFFTTLLTDPRIIKDLAVLFSSSPYLGGIIASRPELIDSFVFRKQELREGDFSQLLEDLAEQRLLTEIVAANAFLADHDVLQLGTSLSESADKICHKLLMAVKTDCAPKSQLEVLPLGKWGGRELGVKSDLDFIFYCPNKPEPDDFRLAKRFVSRLTEQHKGGAIYSVDLRLRPSGNAGPLLVQWSALEEYLAQRSSPWERQSYLRARPLNPLANSQLTKCFASRGLNSTELTELREIRTKLLKTNDTATRINIKLVAGGLIDTELCIQTLILYHKILSPHTNTTEMIDDLTQFIPEAQQYQLKKNYIALRRLEQMFQIKSSRSGSEFSLNSTPFQSTAEELAQSPEELFNSTAETLRQNALIIKSLDPIFTCA